MFDREAYLEAVRSGDGPLTAADAVGVSTATVRAMMSADAEFAAEAKDAERYATEQVQKALYEAAMSGNVPAIQLWLRHRDPERWGGGIVRPAPTEPTPAPDDADLLKFLADSDRELRAIIET